MSDKAIKYRFAVSAVFMLAIIAGLGARLAFLHLGSHEKATRNYKKTLTADRGTIYDRVGRSNVLALNLAVKDVCVDPSLLSKDAELMEVSAGLAEVLDIPAGQVEALLKRKRDSKFARVKRYVHEDKILTLKEKDLQGVFFRDATVRYYPLNSFMCHVLGFVNYVGTGSSGVEQSMDSYLKASPGMLESRLNARRQELYWQRKKHIPATEGANICLSLDQNIQYMVEKELDEVMAEHKAVAAWAIVQRVKTGEVLAMASRPGYDLNEFGSVDDLQKLNRAIGVNYEPGSTFKAAVIAGAINDARIKPSTRVNCENGSWSYMRRILRDGSHSYGILTVADVIKKSSNIGAAKIAILLGDKRLSEVLQSFRIGSRMGIDLPGEEAGIMHPVSKWSRIDSSRIGIGQGVAVTSLQMLGVYNAIANDGYLMKPYVTSYITGKDGTILKSTQPEILSQPISYDTASIMKKMLVRVTEKGGTGWRARVDGYKVAGKTGTAQKAIPGGYSKTDWVASFVGFLPAENPEISIIVVVDSPQPFHSGGKVAAPVFSRIAEQTVRYLDIPPISSNRLVKR